jgi:hypothetical protein
MHSETVNGNPAPFSYAYYRHMLDQCRKAGFTVTSFEDSMRESRGPSSFAMM